MSVINILIGYKDKPLCEYSEYTGNFQQICVEILKQVNPDASLSLTFPEGYTIHYRNENDITYLVMTDQNYPKATVIGCLDSIQTEFKKKYSTYNFDSTPSYGLNQEFSSILKNKFIFYNNNKDVPDEQLNSLKEKLVVMKDQVINANNLLNERGDKINLIVKKAETLQDTSRSFYTSSKKVSLAARMKKIKIYLFIGGALIILLIIGYFLFR